MGLTATALIQTPVFSGRFRRSHKLRPSTSTAADVFGRSERTSSSLAESIRCLPAATVEIEVEEHAIAFYYRGGRSLPYWAEPVFESLASRWGAEAGWDGYCASPTSSSLAATLLTCLAAVMPPVAAKTPTVTPLSDGGGAGRVASRGYFAGTRCSGGRASALLLLRCRPRRRSGRRVPLARRRDCAAHFSVLDRPRIIVGPRKTTKASWTRIACCGGSLRTK